MSDIQYVYPLIHNKVTSPHFVNPTLRRARLIDWLNESATCRAVVVAADAGYGKTTLLWQWEHEVDFPVYWYKLDRSDRDWSLHISYLIEAISQRNPGFGRRAHSMLQQLGGPGSSRPGVAAYLLAEMYDVLTEPCTFIIDDWQFVASVTEVRGLWNQILRDAPSTCRFIFLSRAKPQLQFARFKSHAGYSELRTDTLRFTDREIDELFRDIYQDPLDPTELVELERRTEGWAVSLQLVEVSLRERKTPEDRRSFLDSVTAAAEGDLFQFLAEEVLEQQRGDLREFLLNTSIAVRLTPELCERLTGAENASVILAGLESDGLFTYRLDASTNEYRYHNLFRAFLADRLMRERPLGEVAGLHIHAASYFETAHDWPQAIHHYLSAGLQPQAARLMARYGEDVVAEGRLELVDQWLGVVAERIIASTARLSLLQGEALGMRGDWAPALDALARSRAFFRRKGDRRMEALACLKLSTVHANHGDVGLAAQLAVEGLSLVPSDAYATRLRLEGNLAITQTWMGHDLSAVAKACRRIAVEARSRGLEHFAAIALHNLGATQRHLGDIEGSVQSLQGAAAYWNGVPSNPFADNAELVQALLAKGHMAKATAIASAGVERTRPWPRPHAEALYGRALVHMAGGQFDHAAGIARRLLANSDALGPTAELVAALLVECMYLMRAHGSEIRSAITLFQESPRDPRQAIAVLAARAIARHYSTPCRGQCLTVEREVATWRERGASLSANTAMAKLGSLALEHGGVKARRFALNAFRDAVTGELRWGTRHWLRSYARRAEELNLGSNYLKELAVMVVADPDGWHFPTLEVLARLPESGRGDLLPSIIDSARKGTVSRLAAISGQDVAEARRALLRRDAPRLFISSFGPISIHRHDWSGALVEVDRRRTRGLLGLLVAYHGMSLTRDMAMEILWPESDASAAVNNLNQTVFHLRRSIDPQYRDGESPQYVISTMDSLHLSSALVRTDLDEFRRLTSLLEGDFGSNRKLILAAIDLIRGEYLADFRYEDWVAPCRTSVHAEVRDLLLPIATGARTTTPDAAVRAASALIQLDEFDEPAYLALAQQLIASGKRPAARKALLRYVERLGDDSTDELSPAMAEQLWEVGVRYGQSSRT